MSAMAAVRMPLPKEERRAVETLLALGCVKGTELPWWVWIRTVAEVLREGVYKFPDLDLKDRRGRRPRGNRVDGFDELKQRVRSKLKLDRFPPGIGERIERWARDIQPVIIKRKGYAEREDSAAARKREVWNGVVRRAQEALKACAYERLLVRGAGVTTTLVGEPFSKGDDMLDVGLSVAVATQEGRYYYNQVVNHVDRATGQVIVNARITARVRPSWYGRVYKRGLAIVEGCFVLDVEGYGPTENGETDFLLRVAVPTIGFQVENVTRAAHQYRNGTVVFIEKARGLPWTTLERK